jgi:hypothetical protein
MRPRDPRRLLARRREARARVRVIRQPESSADPDGSVTTKQVAEVTLPRSELERIWSPEYLERLARTYWRFLTRASLGLLRVLYTPESREIALIGRPLVLLRFRAPEYEAEPNRGTVTWRIDRGLLVAPMGRGKGFLRISVERPESPPPGDEITATVSSEVASFYPLIRGWGWFSKIGQVLYRFTQLRIHVIVTHAFLRSLARLDLAPSVVGALRPGPGGELEEPRAEGAVDRLKAGTRP